MRIAINNIDWPVSVFSSTHPSKTNAENINFLYKSIIAFNRRSFRDFVMVLNEINDLLKLY